SRAVGERLRRLGQSLPVLLLPLLALGLVAANPRNGRAFHLIVALLLYVTYSSLSTLAEAQVSRGQWSFVAGLAAVHGLFACLAAALIWYRLRSGLRPRRAKRSIA
ncbi:MAG: LptF/LptG family permease, partial [Betaproteobacteria bacterium]|nr:LptF/LptG family permease [Betaproteobacteria bacterium]